MVANWLKILLFAAGGSTAAAAMVYYTGIHDPWAVEESSAPMAAAEPDEPQSTAETPQEEDAPQAAEDVSAGEATPAAPDDVAQDAPETPGAPAEVAAVAEPEQAEANDDLVVPSFDIVRVEPDGSMVIAGSAEPNSDLEVVSGAEIIARAEVGPSGDFAAVLDDALRPGDYQIVLRSTGPGEGLVTTSLETAVVSVPDTQDGQVLALVEEPGAPSRLITVPEVQAETVVTQEKAAIDAVPESSAAPVEDAPGDQSSAEISAAAQDAADMEEESAPAVTGDDAPAEPDADRAADEAGDEPQIAARSDPRTSPTQDRPASPRNSLAVEAIEIEGGTVFVAGRGAAGTTVRVYANEILLGETRVSEGGRFLIETQTELPVGDYIVRADVIGPGGEVTARAAVPFQREPGEAVAAVAPAERAPAEAGTAESGTPAAPPATAREEVAPAGDGAGTVVGGVSSSTGNATPPASSQSQAQIGGEAAAIEAESDADAPAAAASADRPPADPADEIAAPPGAATAGTGSARTDDAMPQAAAIAETMAEPLQAADGAVIIRRGDTLWRISRRVYGRGVRYSTIYLANQEQIRDPDMIWPGQVFAVPDETEEGEKADMSTVSDQIAPVTDSQ
ncbi:LysM peptidoglycan-binding domain-containing protein [Mesorhizobium sp. YIM 152430]|uniref:LysM peptidoglycan-binding domain-containing protein n=1 Tax=Mesorhizobium sp. YIM 152430 TaxID=3031761 RepID=UPI0023DBF5ED|nr:LysM peptidoglycan-binding domain-containing protein [Mesorhizobium sp. YIM 152430]MDF1600480.1 LysM peptidoglycan-binding domain-containing protein [Mesorhizobium sp. YIM 152430]